MQFTLLRSVVRICGVGVLLGASAWFGSAAASSQFDCPPDFLPLAEATPVQGFGARCYQFQIPDAKPFVRLDIQTDQAVDLYFTEGRKESLTDWDRVNVGPVEGDAKFVLLQPEAGEYTVAVAAPTAATNYSLSASAGEPADDEPLTLCSDDGVCQTVLYMKQGPTAIQLGSKFGDRVILPLTVEGPGKIEVTASWTGSAQELVLILNGPERPELPNPVAYYERTLGSSPLKLIYTVTAKDLERGKRFQVSLVNFGGGEATGNFEIETPPTFRLDYLRAAKLQLAEKLVVLQPVKPAPPVPKPEKPPAQQMVLIPNLQVLQAQTPEQVCQQAVQGKIAWNYDGNKRWAQANVERLCAGTAQGSEPGKCFQRIMHDGVSWGGGTRWQWANAVDLCEGTSSAARTIRCFEAQIRRGASWRDSIAACDSN